MYALLMKESDRMTSKNNTSSNSFLNNLKNILAGVGTLVIAFASGSLVGAILNVFY